MGPFASPWGQAANPNGAYDQVKVGMLKVYPPEKDARLDQTQTGKGGKALCWRQTDKIIGSHSSEGVNFAIRSYCPGFDICYAVTHIHSPNDREILMAIGTDWWCNAYLNGKLVKSQIDPKSFAADACYFQRWKPIFATLKLKKGVNTLLVKNHGGSMNNWFVCYVSYQPDLRFTATPNADTPGRKVAATNDAITTP